MGLIQRGCSSEARPILTTDWIGSCDQARQRRKIPRGCLARCPAAVGILCSPQRVSAVLMDNASNVPFHPVLVYANPSPLIPSCPHHHPRISPPLPPPLRNPAPANTLQPPAMFHIYPSTASPVLLPPGRPIIHLYLSPRNNPSMVTRPVNFKS